MMADDDKITTRMLPTHDETQTVLLHAILAELQRHRRDPAFALTVTVNAGESSHRASGTDSPGVVQMIHNPTAGALTVTLYDGVQPNAAAPPLFSTTLAAGESRVVWISFNSSIVATSGTGARLHGQYRR